VAKEIKRLSEADVPHSQVAIDSDGNITFK
jgi:hypothetical protein